MRSLFPLLLFIGFACKKSKTPDPGPIIAGPQLLEYKIKPSLTNTAISSYDNEHYVYLDDRVSAKNKLLVFFPGTFASPSGYTKVLQKAAEYGYHVIGLMYQNASDMYIGCSFNTDNTCFSNCRLEIFDGSDRTATVTVPVENSIKTRLIKLLQYLQSRDATQNWGQFLNGTDVQWAKCSLAGHSQGGGHAQFIGKLHLVERVISFSSMDWNSALNTSASWITNTGITPIAKYYAVHHTLDELFNYANMQQQWALLGITTFGAPASLDSIVSPYANTHLLYTRATPAATVISPFHNCTVLNAYVPQNASGEVDNKFLKAWEYVLAR